MVKDRSNEMNQQARKQEGSGGIKAIVCLLLLAGTAAAEAGVNVQMMGGTLADIPAKASFRLDLTGTESLMFRGSKGELRIDHRRINTLEYGQNVSRRYAAAILISPVLLLSKSRSHYVTLGYVDVQGRQQAVVFRVGKGDIRAVLAAIEARSGRRVEYQDNEARKSGRL